jgi:DNA-binding IclR family transcriptional regulator
MSGKQVQLAATSPEKQTGAPALEKGLDLIEALAEEPHGLSQKAVAERVGRSVSEIFRMLGVLERRGYVARDDRGHYVLSLRLFELAHRHPPQRRLLEAAQQAMEELSSDVGQASHLVVTHAQRLMVFAQVQPDSVLMGWSVRLGAVFPMSEKYVSARVISAFQRPERQDELVRAMASEPDARPADAIRKNLESIAAAGYDCSPSQIADGVVDVSAPVLNHFGQAVAALTVPYMSQPDVSVSQDKLIKAVRDAAAKISITIGAPNGHGSSRAGRA